MLHAGHNVSEGTVQQQLLVQTKNRVFGPVSVCIAEFCVTVRSWRWCVSVCVCEFDCECVGITALGGVSEVSVCAAKFKASTSKSLKALA
jgi:hypothetical protein